MSLSHFKINFLYQVFIRHILKKHSKNIQRRQPQQQTSDKESSNFIIPWFSSRSPHINLHTSCSWNISQLTVSITFNSMTLPCIQWKHFKKKGGPVHKGWTILFRPWIRQLKFKWKTEICNFVLVEKERKKLLKLSSIKFHYKKNSNR